MKKKFKRTGKHFVYIVKCCDGTLYTGYTPDIDRRVKLHNAGKGAKYTRDRRPVRLVWCKAYKYFKNAFLRELAIKKITRKAKERLVNEYEEKSFRKNVSRRNKKGC